MTNQWTKPVAPTNAVASLITKSSVNLAWDYASDLTVTFVIKEQASQITDKAIAANVRTDTISGLNAATTYNFKVFAKGATSGKLSDASADSTVYTKRAEVTGFTVSATAGHTTDT